MPIDKDKPFNLMNSHQLYLQFSGLVLTLSLLSSATWGSDKLDYVLAPIRTEFQRLEISSTASAILIWNANAVDSDRDGDLLKKCRTRLRDDLRNLSGKAGGLLLIRIQYSGGVKLEKDMVTRLKD